MTTDLSPETLDTIQAGREKLYDLADSALTEAQKRESFVVAEVIVDAVMPAIAELFEAELRRLRTENEEQRKAITEALEWIDEGGEDAPPEARILRTALTGEVTE